MKKSLINDSSNKILLCQTTLFILGVDKGNELPTFFFTKNLIEAQTNTNSWTDVSVKVEDVLEKSEQTISSEKNEDHTQSCKTAQEFIDSKEHTDEKDKDKGRYIRENENENANGNYTSTNFVIKRCLRKFRKNNYIYFN